MIKSESIKNQITHQETLISEFNTKIKELDCDLLLAREMLRFLQSKLSQIQPVKRSLIKPHESDELIMSILKEKHKSITSTEIYIILIQEKQRKISKNGIKASLERLIKENKIKKKYPKQQRYVEYVLIN